MKQYKHDITFHPVDTLGSSGFVCSEDGVCGSGAISDGHTGPLKALLDEHGADGWELVQLSFGGAGVLAFWKREIE